jgi:hypothetical protein
MTKLLRKISYRSESISQVLFFDTPRWPTLFEGIELMRLNRKTHEDEYQAIVLVTMHLETIEFEYILHDFLHRLNLDSSFTVDLLIFYFLQELDHLPANRRLNCASGTQASCNFGSMTSCVILDVSYQRKGVCKYLKTWLLAGGQVRKSRCRLKA